MVEPKTYTGYDKENNIVGTCTAVDANDYINPADVKRAIDNLESVVNEQVSNISKALTSVAPDASHAVIVKGTNMQATIEEMATSISDGTITNSIVGSVDEMYTVAVSSHDQLQNSANDEAYNTILSADGVVKVM